MASFRIQPVESRSEISIPAIRQLYESSFLPEEKVDFPALLHDCYTVTDNLHPFFLAGWKDHQLCGFMNGAYLPSYRAGYIWYLAVETNFQRKGYGSALCRAGWQVLEKTAIEYHGSPPVYTFWEARWPGDAISPSERAVRDTRIRFYEKLGAQILPVTYLCPPLCAGQPQVRFTLMARTHDPSQLFTRKMIAHAAVAGLVLGNGASPDSENVRLAIESIPLDRPAGIRDY